MEGVTGLRLSNKAIAKLPHAAGDSVMGAATKDFGDGVVSVLGAAMGAATKVFGGDGVSVLGAAMGAATKVVGGAGMVLGAVMVTTGA